MLQPGRSISPLGGGGDRRRVGDLSLGDAMTAPTAPGGQLATAGARVRGLSNKPPPRRASAAAAPPSTPTCGFLSPSQPSSRAPLGSMFSRWSCLMFVFCRCLSSPPFIPSRDPLLGFLWLRDQRGESIRTSVLFPVRATVYAGACLLSFSFSRRSYFILCFAFTLCSYQTG